MKRLNSLILLTLLFFGCSQLEKKIIPLRTVVDLNMGENKKIKISNGEIVDLTLISIKDSIDELNKAVRAAKIEILVDGTHKILDVANYHLPVTVGNMQIDCPITIDYLKKSRHSSWKLKKDARLRLWPKESSFLRPNTFVYPLKQRIFANDTQMDNEPVYVNGDEKPALKSIYYHSGLDFGGFEGKEEVLSTVDGIVIISGKDILIEYKKKLKGELSYDGVTILDKRGWYHEYFHLTSIDTTIFPGAKVKMGQKIGLVGKEGASGGWAHLHYSITSKQPSGELGEENAFPYIFEAYVKQYNPTIIAIARPHKFVPTGEKVILEGYKSKSFKTEIISYKWILSNGSTVDGVTQERIYTIPGTYSEILKVTDSKGNIDYDYTVVQVVNMEEPEKIPPTIHAVYYPTFGIKAGDTITFGVRTFRTDSGHEEWDFGDGSEIVIVKSVLPKDIRKGMYAEAIHCYEKPGQYLVRVERANENGYKATAHLHVEVNKN